MSGAYPYKKLERLKAWKVVEKAIKELVANGDLQEQTARRYIVGYLVKLLTEKKALTFDRSGTNGAIQDEANGYHFAASDLRHHRAKLGLSARDYGKLLGVSGLTIYHWEAGKAKPRDKHLSAISNVRTLGKNEAIKRIQDSAE